MKELQKKIVLLTAIFIMANGACYYAFADHDRERKRNKHGEHSENYGKHGKRSLNPVTNQTYKETCGACHFAYQPGLLPSGSWEKILAGLNAHFGETVDLDSESKKVIAAYLKSDAAEYSSAKLSAKIMKSLRQTMPSRITEIPLFIKKHHKISSDVLKRKSAKSLSDCMACHKTADKGIYDKIPK